MEEGTRVNEKMSLIWKKGFSVELKNVLAASFVAFSVPFVVPALVVVSTMALILSLPSCFFMASYIFSEKLMRKLLPDTAFGGRCESCGHELIPLPIKIDHDNIYDQCIARVATREPVYFRNEEEGTTAIAYKEDEDMRTDLKSFLESIRDLEDRTNQSIDSGIFENGLIKEKVSAARREGEPESITTEASKGKDMKKCLDKMKVLYSEEQICAKIEAIRQVVGYNVTRSMSYSEELKALYMFMGVEEQTSTLEKDSQDIAVISERICFLMSVIGIE